MARGRRKQFPTQCKRNGCRNLTHEVYCDEHANYRNEADKSRASASRRGYDARWRRARKHHLAKNPLCVMCGCLATDVDHIKSHKGSYKLFWDEKNWQSLCSDCHKKKTAKEDMDSWDTHKGLQ